MKSQNPLGEDGVFNSSSNANAGLNAFTSGFYAFAKSQGCVRCHDNNISPPIASSDVNTAYQAAMGTRTSSNTRLVDFNNPSASVLADFAGNSHCGVLACSDPNASIVAQRHIEDWAAAELTVNEPVSATPVATFKFVTAALRVPVAIPNIQSATPAVLRFDLSLIKPAVTGLQGAILEIEIQYVNTNVYRLNKPKIVGATTSLVFSDLRLHMKQVADVNVLGVEDLTYTTNWHSLVRQAALVAKPATLPTGPFPVATVTPLIDMPLYYVTTTGADYFTITFGDIKLP